MKRFTAILLFVAAITWAQPGPQLPPPVPSPVMPGMPPPMPAHMAPQPVAAPAPAAVAQTPDAGVAVVDPGTVPVSTALDNPEIFIKYVYTGVKTGNWVLSISALLVLLVAGLKMFGQKIHDMLPKNNVLWGFFDFMLNTKPGGWLMNVLTSLAAGVGSAILTEGTVTMAVIKPVVMVSLSAAAIWGGVKDFWEWYKGTKAGAKVAADVTAKVEKVAPGVVGQVAGAVEKVVDPAAKP